MVQGPGLVSLMRTWNRLAQEGILTFRSRHWDDVSLEVPLHDIPRPLVDDERRLAGQPRVHVRLRDNPGRRVRDPLNRDKRV